MPTVKVNGKSILCENGENLYKVLLRGGTELNAPCGGFGTCGKCGVWVEGAGKVNACRYTVEGDVHVNLSTPRSEIATKGYLRSVSADSEAPSIAVDIGTTTVVAYLVADGGIADVESALNPQKPYGDDVITRIKFTAENDGGTEILHRLITRQVAELADALCARNGVKTENIAVAGNTTMLHLFAGVSPVSIGTAPFTPAFTALRKLGGTTLLPSIAGYVGADTVAAVLSCGMHLSDKKCLLIDVGTNGEIALGNRDGIVACAAAAGPAIEGAQISCGVGGVAGAVNTVTIDGGGVSYTTIDNLPPIGICGSGILDAAAQMFNAGIIDETGYFEEESLQIAERVSINARDIRQIQLAKSAIAAGIHTLLAESGTKPQEVEFCYLAGGFGSYLNQKSACDIGLIPKEFSGKILPVGNAAGMGTVLWQLSSVCRDETEKIVNMTKYFELSDSVTFNEHFINCMYF
ncbi:MAG: ASKHA domain-containing protein [Clostridiales bacterium]|jgi:uncharacterized 2Fe-2S/4Fe-4S cluster protein (DUF4445 family)|nr:ASKHA domain-containing protein [Clostridiales bacterium]